MKLSCLLSATALALAGALSAGQAHAAPDYQIQIGHNDGQCTLVAWPGDDRVEEVIAERESPMPLYCSFKVPAQEFNERFGDCFLAGFYEDSKAEGDDIIVMMNQAKGKIYFEIENVKFARYTCFER